MEKAQKIEISPRTIVFTVFFLLFLQVLWMVRELLFSLFIAFMIMSVIKPIVTRLENRGVPRTLSTLFIFIILIGLISYGIYWILPPLIQDMSALFRNLSILLEDLDPAIRQYFNNGSFTKYIPNITNQIFPFIKNLFTNIIFVVTTIFFSFYFTIEENFIRKFFNRFLKESDAEKVARIADKTEKRLGSWFWGELILMVAIGLVTYILLSLIGVRHALSLAVIAGLLEAFPIIGPIIAAVPAFIFAVNQYFLLGIYTIVLYIFIQQIENNLLVPLVMKRAVGLNKIIILIVLIIGGKLAGVLGIFLAIPVTLFIESILSEVVKSK